LTKLAADARQQDQNVGDKSASKAVQETFEATAFWRGILDKAFWLREKGFEVDGARVLLWTHPFYRRAISTPYRDRMAISWDRPVNEIDQFALLEGSRRFGDVTLKDIFDVLPDKSADFGDAIRHQHTNSAVPLDEGVDSRLRRSAKKNLRRATEEFGLQFEVNPIGRFSEFYEIYLGTRKRLGVPPYEKLFFRLLFDGIGGPVVLFRCHDSKMTYGYLLVFLHGSEMISAHIGYDFSHREKKIADFLFVNAFRWGAKNGYSEYRFGGDYKNQDSLIFAKTKLGAETRAQWDLVVPPRPVVLDEPDSIVRKVLRSTPMAGFRHAGALTRVYFQ